jgi:hypothetical protein
MSATPPVAIKVPHRNEMTRCANNGSGPNLFDDGVGAEQERFRDGSTYGFRGLGIDCEIVLGGLLDWYISRKFALQNSTNEPRAVPERRRSICSERKQTSVLRKRVGTPWCRNTVLDRQVCHRLIGRLPCTTIASTRSSTKVTKDFAQFSYGVAGPVALVDRPIYDRPNPRRDTWIGTRAA